MVEVGLHKVQPLVEVEVDHKELVEHHMVLRVEVEVGHHMVRPLVVGHRRAQPLGVEGHHKVRPLEEVEVGHKEQVGHRMVDHLLEPFVSLSSF